jgi:hypothetical protein
MLNTFALSNSKLKAENSKFTPTLQKPEGFRVKASEGEVVVLYFDILRFAFNVVSYEMYNGSLKREDAS